MKNIKTLVTRENVTDNIKAVTMIENEIINFKQCQSRKKVVNHEEYIRGMIDMGFKLNCLSVATGRRLIEKMMDQKKLKMREFDEMHMPV